MTRAVRIERKESEAPGVATLWLSNPAHRNALGTAFWEEFPACMEELEGDASVRCIVLAAEGRDFSVGIDLGFLAGAFGGEAATGQEGRSEVGRRMVLRTEIERLQAVIGCVATSAKPVVAAIHGYCLGGGLDLATACDIRLASEDAIFSLRETRMAMVADLGSLQRLPALVGKGVALELSLTGDDVSATRAREIGLVNATYETREGLLDAAQGMAERIAQNSPLAVQGTKKVLRYCEGKSVEDGLDYVATWNTAFIESEDLREAIRAFFAKRPPKFHGR